MSEVAMQFAECPTCDRTGHTVGDGQPLGINCGACGHHFHIGDFRLIGGAISCPRCDRTCPPIQISDSSPQHPDGEGVEVERLRKALRDVDFHIGRGDPANGTEAEIRQTVRAALGEGKR